MMETYIQPGKRTLEENKRIEKQLNETLASIHSAQKNALLKEEMENREKVLSAARFSVASGVARTQSRVRNLKEEIEYAEKASIAGMTKMLSRVVNEALLMDTEEFAKLNPGYKETITETVKSFLENAELQDNIENKDTLALMEYVARITPDVSLGKLLEAEGLEQAYDKETPEEVERSIADLAGSVKKKIAKLIGKEQKKTQELQDEIDALVAASTPAEEVVEEEVPVEGEEIVTAEDGTTTLSAPAGTHVEIRPDGTISIMKESFIREARREHLLETLAVNEAMTMISEGKEYNSDIAIGNSLIYLTILETFNATGLLPLTEADYNRVIKTAGGESEAKAQKVARANFAPKKVEEKKVETKVESAREGLKDFELKAMLEKKGFDFSVDTLEEIAEGQGYIKKQGLWFKK